MCDVHNELLIHTQHLYFPPPHHNIEIRNYVIEYRHKFK